MGLASRQSLGIFVVSDRDAIHRFDPLEQPPPSTGRNADEAG
jgi:hypothetical protein